MRQTKLIKIKVVFTLFLLQLDEVKRLFNIPQYLERTDIFKKNNMKFDHLDMIDCGFTANRIT